MALDTQVLDEILSKTVTTVESSQREIFDITEHAVLERERLNLELERVRAQIANSIATTDRLEKELRRARLRLAEVSRQVNPLNEEKLQEVYTEAQQLQLELRLMEVQEKRWRDQRDDLQRRLRQMDELIEKAQNLATQIGVVLNYLTGGILEISRMVQEAKAVQELGLKVIEAQEKERKRVAREIHDGPAQSLANILLQTEMIDRACQKGQADVVQQEIMHLKRTVRDTLADIRSIIFDLRPMALDDLGLVPTLNKYVAKMQATTEVELVLRVLGREPELPSAMVDALFRLVQEGMANVLKHARANRFTVKLEFQPAHLYVVMEDDGVGFNVEERKEGYGLVGMRERVKLLEGEFQLNSAPGQGTKIVVKVPIKTEKNGVSTEHSPAGDGVL